MGLEEPKFNPFNSGLFLVEILPPSLRIDLANEEETEWWLELLQSLLK